jgi:hypothetical protein
MRQQTQSDSYKQPHIINQIRLFSPIIYKITTIYTDMVFFLVWRNRKFLQSKLLSSQGKEHSSLNGSILILTFRSLFVSVYFRMRSNLFIDR